MKTVGYIAIFLSPVVFVLGLAQGVVTIVEPLLLFLVGCLATAVHSIRKSQLELLEISKKNLKLVRNLESTVVRIENDTCLMGIEKRSGVITASQVDDILDRAHD